MNTHHLLHVYQTQELEGITALVQSAGIPAISAAPKAQRMEPRQAAALAAASWTAGFPDHDTIQELS